MVRPLGETKIREKKYRRLLMMILSFLLYPFWLILLNCGSSCHCSVLPWWDSEILIWRFLINTSCNICNAFEEFLPFWVFYGTYQHYFLLLSLFQLLGSNSSDSAQSSSVLGLQKPVGPSYLEPVATVKPKCLQKAMTPPLTIKTFFKPSNGVLKSEESNNCEKEPENCSSSQSIKRPSFKSPPVAKRQKQSNIMASFAQAEKKERLKRTCPICQKEFPATAMNTEINKHIDNCLIE